MNYKHTSTFTFNLQNVRDQYPTADYELTKKVVRFSTTENPAVQVKHREHIGEGWTLKRISSQSSVSDLK